MIDVWYNRSNHGLPKAIEHMKGLTVVATIAWQIISERLSAVLIKVTRNQKLTIGKRVFLLGIEPWKKTTYEGDFSFLASIVDC